MPWDEQDYPASFKNLDKEVRHKAIEIANALLEEKYDEGRAIAIAISKARDYVHGDDNSRTTYEVKPEKEDWILVEKGGDRAIYKEAVKEDLLEKAKPYVNDKDGILAVYHADGSLQDTLYK
ncbi:hypothetical protein NCCP2222_08470 [Sporosarcina sp. NCCP-2222]|uniref:hypothetical protein n=1 Tax=Sporosarcina sp. NCCP-2222 TaxID=2935073 RepID=UPI002084E98E|nr:hypothetical protein [Sporosarcina sp. NCCP-2222]GKV54900.1 hypothetical protein NCCP2222_08470 [Sporosarcina sp. NCCP-2222]